MTDHEHVMTQMRALAERFAANSPVIESQDGFTTLDIPYDKTSTVTVAVDEALVEPGTDPEFSFGYSITVPNGSGGSTSDSDYRALTDIDGAAERVHALLAEMPDIVAEELKAWADEQATPVPQDVLDRLNALANAMADLSPTFPDEHRGQVLRMRFDQDSAVVVGIHAGLYDVVCEVVLPNGTAFDPRDAVETLAEAEVLARSYMEGMPALKDRAYSVWGPDSENGRAGD